MAALLVYMLFGLALAWRVLPAYRWTVKCWLGLVFGCTALMWLPCLPAFFLGFTMPAQYTALGLACAGTAALVLLRKKRAPAGEAPASLPEDPASPTDAAPLPEEPAPQPDAVPLTAARRELFTREDQVGLLLSAMAAAFCFYLLYTHVLLPHEDGSLWVGQSTYGDLAMHLGFVESLYRQGTFPPEYSIYPGQLLDYPFLVDAASASLRFFGMSLRWSVIAPSTVMLFCVFWGFWLLAEKLLKKLAPTMMAWLLFVFNGGFGFIYFMGKYTPAELLDGFYITPTNLVDEDLRWVNVICDMLIPQRTTMAGWCVGLGVLFLLITAIEKTMDPDESARREFLVLAALAGTMPMIHTHSFLAVGVLSAGWFFAWLPKAKKTGRLRALIEGYVIYGVVCFALALPQLITWTFDAASTGNLIWFNPGWVHGDTNWLLFWLMNGGVVLCAIIPMMLLLRGDRARLFWGAALVFALGNLVAFQPNPYDDNKLLYFWYMVVDILACGWMWELLERLPYRSMRQALASVLVILGTLSGALTMAREAVSEYELFSPEQVRAAEYIESRTAPDSIFLTGTEHTNPVAVLAGRNILCGAGMYLYYHGVDYGAREALIPQMYRGGETFETYADHFGVDYVFIGPTELYDYEVNTDYFRENYSLIYDREGISIFQIS